MDLNTPRAIHLSVRLIATAAVLFFSLGRLGAQSDEPAEKPQPVTVGNPEISVDELGLLLRPLTQEELIVEADGWRDVVKDKLQEISELKISLMKKADEEQADEEQAAEEQTAEASAASSEEVAGADTAESLEPPELPSQQADDAQSTADQLALLQEHRTQRIDRLNHVVDELESKGGEVEGYRQYVSAVSGLTLDMADKQAGWTLLKGWVTSEQGGQRWLWNIVKFLSILAVFYFAASILAGFVRHAVAHVRGASQLLVDFLSNFCKHALRVIGFIVALSALEVNITPLLAAVGAAGFVIAMALQGTLSNFASGLLILLYQPFDVGDVIEAAGVSGIVKAVTLFSTHVQTFDNKLMIVPNNDIWGGTITNATASETRRIDMEFGIGYDDDIDLAKGILERLVDEHPLVLEEPEPVVRLHTLADSSMNFICRPWSKTGDYWAVYWDLTRSVKQEFDRNGISIPFPQQDVHVHQQPAAETGAGAV